MIKRSLKIATVLAAAALSGCAVNSRSSGTQRSLVTDYGAVGDGKTLNTLAIQKTIDQTASTGGGTVVIPKGVFLSGAIFLKPGVGLEVQKDGVLKSTADLKDFPQGMTRIEGHFQMWVPALVNADHVDHVRITGEGTLDGSGQPFYDKFYSLRAANNKTTNLDVPRPRMVFIRESNDVEVSGLHFLNSGFWNLHVYKCDGIVVNGIDILAPSHSPSTDGIDVDSCQNVEIEHCTIANNDDCIALKGTKGNDAMKDKTSPPDEHIHVHDCTITRGPVIVTCGSEATIVRDVHVDHCTVAAGTGTQGLSLLRLKLRPDTPEEYSDIHFSDITMDGGNNLVGCAPWRQYFTTPGGPRSVHDISFTNIHGTANSGIASIQGNPGDTIERLTFENVDLKIARPRGQIVGAKDVVYKNVKINGQDYDGPPPSTQPVR